MGQSGAPIPSNQAKYFDLLARYYVSKRQHVLAAHVLLRLAERRSTDTGDVPTLEQRLATSSFHSFLLPSFELVFYRKNVASFNFVTSSG
jgi:hypothetical protein